MLSGFINNVTRPPTIFKANSAEVCFDADSVRRRTRASRFAISDLWRGDVEVCGLQTFVQERRLDSIRIWYHRVDDYFRVFLGVDRDSITWYFPYYSTIWYLSFWWLYKHIPKYKYARILYLACIRMCMHGYLPCSIYIHKIKYAYFSVYTYFTMLNINGPGLPPDTCWSTNLKIKIPHVSYGGSSYFRE
jgi:hypothetical protein